MHALENGIGQHRYHIGRLEQMMRLLDNADLSPDQVRFLINFHTYFGYISHPISA
jgi:CCR4-NOT transcriptional regulation complex NOT5 subunit